MKKPPPVVHSLNISRLLNLNEEETTTEVEEEPTEEPEEDER